MNRVIPTFTGYLTQALASGSTTLFVPVDFFNYVSSALNFGAGDYFYLSISEGILYEEVKVTNKGANYLVVTRARGGTTAQNFTALAQYNTALTKAGVLDISLGNTPVAGFVVTADGQASVDQSPAGTFNVHVPAITINGLAGIEVSKIGQVYQIGISADLLCSGDSGAGSPSSVSVIGAGIASVVFAAGIYTVTVPAPVFTGVGVSVTGTWPNLTITASGGGGGTVLSVAAGPGLSITGGPTVNPTVNMDNTLPGAVNTDDIDFNARGQAIRIDPEYNPISIITPVAPLSVSRALGNVTISVVEGAEGVVGVVALADSASPLDPGDVTTAVTPKLLSSVIADLAGGSLSGGQSYSGEADASYTDTVATTAILLDIPSGESVLVIANVTVQDSATPAAAQRYGMAVFSSTGAARLQSNKSITQNSQTMIFILSGPFTDGLVLKTTALTGTVAVASQSLVAIKV